MELAAAEEYIVGAIRTLLRRLPGPIFRRKPFPNPYPPKRPPPHEE